MAQFEKLLFEHSHVLQQVEETTKLAKGVTPLMEGKSVRTGLKGLIPITHAVKAWLCEAANLLPINEYRGHRALIPFAEASRREHTVAASQVEPDLRRRTEDREVDPAVAVEIGVQRHISV